MLRDRQIRYEKAAMAAREKATTARDPEQWLMIADGWDELARRVEMERIFRSGFSDLKIPTEPKGRQSGGAHL